MESFLPQMNVFKKYPHLESFGNEEVEGIEAGISYIFPKIDGTNASVWMKDGSLGAGSRNRELSLEDDNAGFFAAISKNERIISFLKENEQYRLFGEWLVPHSVKHYREDAWRKFYIFDVAQDDGEGLRFLPYESYKSILDAYGIEYIPALCSVENPRLETLLELLNKNVYLIEDGKGFGEGITIKNYAYVNKYGRTTFAKLVRNEFKEAHAREFKVQHLQQQKSYEEDIARHFISLALVEKTKAKITLEKDGWSSKNIPQLLSTVYYELIREEIWEILKKYDFPTINFKILKGLTTQQIKHLVPHIFT